MKLAVAVAGLWASISPAEAHLRVTKLASADLGIEDTTIDVVEEEDLKKFEDLERQVLAMARSDVPHAAPMNDVGEMISKSLMPDILNASEHAQTELDQIMEAFTDCSPAKLNEGDLQNLSASRKPLKLAHDECRMKEEKAHNDNIACANSMKSLKGAMDAACNAVDAVKRDPGDAAQQCNPSPGMSYEDWLNVNKDWFIKQAEQYNKLVQQCAEAKRAYLSQKPACEAKETAVKAAREVCNLKQTALEDAYCNVNAALQQSCTDYSECFSSALETYNDRVPVIKAQEKARKVNWRVLKRIECLVPILGSGDKAKIEACRKKEHDTKHLDLTYENPPKESSCDSPGPMPCSEEFQQVAYGGLPLNAAAAECQVCPGGAPPAYEQFKVGLATGTEVCISAAVYEYTKDWDCSGQDLASIVVPDMGNDGWKASLSQCAAECASRDDCSSFNYPVRGGNNRCWIKYGFRKSQSRGWNCRGGMSPTWQFFTKIPGRKCDSPAPAVKWSLPSGIQNNFPLASLPQSWKVHYDKPYSDRTTTGNIIPGSGDCLLWGAKTTKDSDSLYLAAFGKRSVVASAGSGKWENGAYWYLLNKKSNGFADTNSLSLNSADTFDGKSNKRLSWHLGQSAGGWRSGTKKGLNSNRVWRKIVMSGPCEVQ